MPALIPSRPPAVWYNGRGLYTISLLVRPRRWRKEADINKNLQKKKSNNQKLDFKTDNIIHIETLKRVIF